MITQPTLLLDETRCRANIRRMADKARAHGLDFRPHCKTHQSLAIGRWLREAGVEKITVSSVAMAAYFAREWDDITIAFLLLLPEHSCMAAHAMGSYRTLAGEAVPRL